jgi:RNA recognition motif-containing protein
MKKLYVGRGPLEATENELQDWFGQAGFKVESVTLIRDRFSGESRGFGFVKITNHEEAQRAIRSLNGKNFLGSLLVVNEARPLPEGPGRRRDRGGHHW